MNNMKPTIITRKEAKKMAISRDCHCVKGKSMDNNYKECIDKIFDWIDKHVITECPKCGNVLSCQWCDPFNQPIPKDGIEL